MCDFCDGATAFCGPGTTCGAARCEKYCCADSDCEGQGRCILATAEPELAPAGFCEALGSFQCGPIDDEPAMVSPAADAGLADAAPGG